MDGEEGSGRAGQARQEFGILGPLTIADAGHPVELRGAKLRALLVMLLIGRGEVLALDRLIEGLWGEHAPESAVNTLHGYVSKLRKLLGRELIQTYAGGYVVTAPRGSIDAVQFEDLAQGGKDAARAGDWLQASTLLNQALSLWRGEALEEFRFEPFAELEVVHLEEARLAAEEERVEAELALGHHRAAVGVLQQLARAHPLRERFWAQLMLALYRCGRQADALRCYSELRRHLGEELGIAPSVPLQELEQAILLQDPTLAAPASRKNSVEPATDTAAHRTPAPARPVPAVDDVPFLGREAELNLVLSELESPSGVVFVVSGRTGMGKTRLLSEIASRAPVPVLSVRALRLERNDPWALLRRLLQQALEVEPAMVNTLPDAARHALAHVLPVQVPVAPGSGSLDGESRRALVLEAGSSLVAAAARGGAVVVDDVHWANSTTLTLLASLVRTREVALVVAHTPDSVGGDQALAEFLADLTAGSARHVPLVLGPLGEADLACRFADRRLAEAVGSATNGVPVAVAQVLRELLRRGAVVTRSDGTWDADGDGAHEIAEHLARDGHRRWIELRLEPLSHGRKETLQLLAVAGRPLPVRVLAAVDRCGHDPLLDDLSGLARAHLVGLDEGGWGVADESVRGVVIGALDAAARGRLHQLLAEALVGEGEDPADVARHWVGAGDKGAAAASFAEAACQRLVDYAAEEARSLAEAGLRLGPSKSVRRGLLEARAAARELLGEGRAARNDLRELLRATPPGPDRASLLARIALLSTSDELPTAERLVDVALTEAGQDRRARAEVLSVAAIVDGNLDKHDRAQSRSAAALALFEELGDPRGAAVAINANANSLLFEGHVREASAMLERVARLYEDAGSLLRVGTPLSMAGWARMVSGHPAEGLALVDEALDLESMLGQVDGRGFCLWARSDVLRVLGRVDEAGKCAEEAVALNLQVGDRAAWAMAVYALAMVRATQCKAREADHLLQEALDGCEGLVPHGFIAGRRSTLAMGRGDTSKALLYSGRCLRSGPRIGRYEGRLVQAEMRLLEKQPRAADRALELLAETESEGYVVSPSRDRLQELLGLRIGPRAPRRAAALAAC